MHRKMVRSVIKDFIEEKFLKFGILRLKRQEFTRENSEEVLKYKQFSLIQIFFWLTFSHQLSNSPRRFEMIFSQAGSLMDLGRVVTTMTDQ